MGNDDDISVRIAAALDGLDEARRSGQGVEAWLVSTLGEQDANEVLGTLRRIAENHADVQGADDGREVWLARRLAAASAKLKADDAIHVPEVTTPGAPAATLARQMSAALSGSLQAGLDGDGRPAYETPVEAARAFFERELGHVDDVETVAAVTTVVLPLVRETMGQDAVEATPSVVAAAVDLGASTAKAAYHVGTDRVESATGRAWVLDRMAAAIGTLVEQAAPALLEQGGEALGAVVGGLFRMAPLGARVGRSVGRLAGNAVAKPLGQGVRALVKHLPAMANKVLAGAKAMGRRVLDLFS